MSVSTNRASVLLNRVSLSSKRRLTLEKKDIRLIKQSLCLNQTNPLCMFKITTRVLYVVSSQPCHCRKAFDSVDLDFKVFVVLLIGLFALSNLFHGLSHYPCKQKLSLLVPKNVID